MAEHSSFLADLEDAVSKGTAESCLQALWHATDLLIAGSYSEGEIWTFGEVIGRLAEEIEQSARIRLASRLASCKNAPFDIVRKLACDDSIGECRSPEGHSQTSFSSADFQSLR